MTCPSCHAKVRATTKFCPHCGAQTFRDPSAYATNVLTQGAKSPEEVPTQPFAANPPNLPKKYAARLATGTPPERIIVELLKRNARQRTLLEKLAKKLPSASRNALAAAITTYLCNHCAVCGERAKTVNPGEKAFCTDCSE